jgi:hypothetical protein
LDGRERGGVMLDGSLVKGGGPKGLYVMLLLYFMARGGSVGGGYLACSGADLWVLGRDIGRAWELVRRMGEVRDGLWDGLKKVVLSTLEVRIFGANWGLYNTALQIIDLYFCFRTGFYTGIRVGGGGAESGSNRYRSWRDEMWNL